MADTSTARLYTPDILALAVELSAFPFSSNSPNIGEARSRTCGSRVRLGCTKDAHGGIGDLGLDVTACAIGQAAAALFAHDARGRTAADISRASTAIETWLTGQGNTPPWRGLGVLDGARAHPGRHGAILLPWKAAEAALSNATQPR